MKRHVGYFLIYLLPTALLAQTNPCASNGDYVRLYNQATDQYQKGQYAAAAINFDKAGRLCPSCTDCQAQTLKANKAEQARIARREEQARVAAKAQADQAEVARVAKAQADQAEAARIAKAQADREEAARVAAKAQADQAEAARVAKAQADREEAARIIAQNKADRKETARVAAKSQARIYKETGAVYVAGGTFEMGSNQGDADAQPNEMVRGKKHRVEVGSFYMAKTEVTQAQWRAVIGSDPPELYNKGCDNCPVEGVSYKDAEAFLAKLNGQQSAHRYRLPTEAEWEYAARGGANWTDGYVYAGSNNIGDVAWYDGNYKDSKHGSIGTTYPVGTKQANQLGLHDLTGNVYEWCADWYKGYPGSSGVSDYTNTYRVLRGGTWAESPPHSRVAWRLASAPPFRYGFVGFRWVFSQ